MVSILRYVQRGLDSLAGVDAAVISPCRHHDHVGPTDRIQFNCGHARGKADVLLPANRKSSRYRHGAGDAESCEAYGVWLAWLHQLSVPLGSREERMGEEPVYARCQLNQKDLDGLLRCVSLEFDQGNPSPIAFAKLTSRSPSHITASTCQSGIRDAICVQFRSEVID